MNIPNIRQLSQQLAAPQFDTPWEVVDWFGFMQAQEKSMIPWAVAMRTRRPSLAAYRQAYDQGQLIRTHLFRCTWQLTTAQDLRWMVQLCADSSRRAARGYLKQTGGAISEDEEKRANDLIAKVLQGRGSVTGKELKAMLTERGLTNDAHTMSVYLRFAEYDGIICSGKYHPSQTPMPCSTSASPPNPPSPATRRWPCWPASISAATPPLRLTTSCGGQGCPEAIAVRASRALRAN
ncbi:MAG: winged helix DNA-binding domain-containing protein [Muribaculaceae bacterium]|nr:winged helix DNA-binding domain-containing protein [Muribaculaceae bacterium]